MFEGLLLFFLFVILIGLFRANNNSKKKIQNLENEKKEQQVKIEQGTSATQYEYTFHDKAKGSSQVNQISSSVETNLNKTIFYPSCTRVSKKDRVQFLSDYLDNDGFYHIVFSCINRRRSLILKEYCIRNSIFIERLPNIFEYDISENYHAVFENKLEHTDFIHDCYSSFGSSYSILGMSIEILYYCLNGYPENKISNEQLITGKKVLQKVYEKYNEPCLYDSFPIGLSEFCVNNCSLKIVDVDYVALSYEIVHKDSYLPYRPNVENHEAYVAKHYEKKEELRQKKELLYTEILAQNGSNVKWTSEYNLFLLAKSKYPDTIYQFHAPWLEKLSLDVYIPSINLGIEYQGKQHYEPVEYFGGEEHFQIQQANDKKKKKLCKLNGVKLLEIRYDETINPVILDEKIEKIMKTANAPSDTRDRSQ